MKAQSYNVAANAKPMGPMHARTYNTAMNPNANVRLSYDELINFSNSFNLEIERLQNSGQNTISVRDQITKLKSMKQGIDEHILAVEAGTRAEGQFAFSKGSLENQLQMSSSYGKSMNVGGPRPGAPPTPVVASIGKGIRQVFTKMGRSERFQNEEDDYEDEGDWIVGTMILIFIAFILSPGVLLTLPPVGGRIWMTRKTSLTSAFFHAVLIGLVFNYI